MTGPTLSDAPGSFTRFREMRQCPQCHADTSGRRACPLCELEFDDALVDRVQRAAHAQLKRQIIAVALAVYTAFLVIGTGSIAYALGKRANTVAARLTARATDAQTLHDFRALPADMQRNLHALMIRNLFAPGILPVAGVRFTQIPVDPAHAPTGEISDLTLVASSDSGWKQRTLDERQVMLTALSRVHQRYLADVGLPDTTHYAVAIAVASLDPSAPLRYLAIRMRDGQGRIAP